MHKYIATINDKDYLVELHPDGKVIVDGKSYDVDFEIVSGQFVYSLIVDGHSYETQLHEDDDGYNILMRGDLYTVQVEDEREKRLKDAAGLGADTGSGYILKSPMPGLIVKVPVKEGDAIEKGDVLVILESMKMQNELKSPKEGTVTKVSIKEGDSVEQRQIIIEME